MHNVRERADIGPAGSKWPQTAERIALDLVEGWRNDQKFGADDAELARRIAEVIQGDRDATKRVLQAYGL